MLPARVQVIEWSKDSSRREISASNNPPSVQTDALLACS